MAATLPFLTTYDPPGTSEGSLDPLGLYQIADQLAVQLVPVVRERMQRIRFLTAMAVGSLVTEGLEDDPRLRDASPYLAWEWLVVEALIRERRSDPGIWGVPGSQVVHRALGQHGYIDARSYLKTPRIFGFNGVYKRLAIHLGLVDVHLGPGPSTEHLVDAWARGLGFAGIGAARRMISRWTNAVGRSLAGQPPRTKPAWGSKGWAELASAFFPGAATGRERRYLREILLAAERRRLGALPLIWELQPEFNDNEFREELLHKRLREREPEYGPLVEGIRAYEAFARSLEDAFDVLRAEAGRSDGQGFQVPWIARDPDFLRAVEGLDRQFEVAHRALGEVGIRSMSLQNLFADRFRTFAEPTDAATSALAMCAHHEGIQLRKSAEGKRPWFDRLGQDRIHIRHAYRDKRGVIEPDRYVHDYRGQPIRRFYKDLS